MHTYVCIAYQDNQLMECIGLVISTWMSEKQKVNHKKKINNNAMASLLSYLFKPGGVSSKTARTLWNSAEVVLWLIAIWFATQLDLFCATSCCRSKKMPRGDAFECRDFIRWKLRVDCTDKEMKVLFEMCLREVRRGGRIFQWGEWGVVCLTCEMNYYRKLIKAHADTCKGI